MRSSLDGGEICRHDLVLHVVIFLKFSSYLNSAYNCNAHSLLFDLNTISFLCVIYHLSIELASDN